MDTRRVPQVSLLRPGILLAKANRVRPKSNDTATIQSTANTLGQMEAEKTAAHSVARAQFYAILTADQKAKFAELEKSHMMGPGHGPMR